MEKAGITSAEEQVAFDAIWYSANWLKSQEWESVMRAVKRKKL